MGKTGFSVSILGLGGGGVFFSHDNRDEALEILNRAIDLGVNYLDTAPSYGASEDHYGEILNLRREEVFLATKVHPRGYDDAKKTMDASVTRLKTDHIDLIQVHDIQSSDDFDQAFDGSLKAMVEARDEGIVRWIGVTGHHDPDALAYAIERFDFDTVLMPVNITDKHYLSFIDNVLPMALKRNMGVIAMKVYCAGGVFENLDVTPKDSLRYALSFPVSTAIVGVDNLHQLLENIEIVRQFEPMRNEEQTAMLDRTRDKAAVCSSKFKHSPG